MGTKQPRLHEGLHGQLQKAEKRQRRRAHSGVLRPKHTNTSINQQNPVNGNIERMRGFFIFSGNKLNNVA